MKGDDKKAAEPQPEGGWQYKPAVADESGPADTTAVEWSASEFVDHEKGFGWYAALALIALVVAAGVYLATRDILSVAVVVIMAGILGVAGSHKPRTTEYRLDASGLTAGKKFYPYRNYKSFVMPDEGPFISVMLIPLRRFDFPAGAYLAPDSQDQALELLSQYVPMEHRKPSFFDTLIRRLRF